MKTYKLKGLDIYIANVFSKEDAVIVCLINKIGITVNDLVETDYKVDRNIVAELIRSESELLNMLD